MSSITPTSTMMSAAPAVRHLARVVEHEAQLRDLRRDAERGEHADEHRDAAEPRHRAGVHVALADARMQAELHAELPHRDRDREGDRGRDAGDEDVEDYAHLSAPTTRTISSLGMTPSRTMRSLPAGRRRASQPGRIHDRRGHVAARRRRPARPRRSRRARRRRPRRGRRSRLAVRFALETASGPVSDSSSSAMRWSGIRTATVPAVSPRSHVQRRLRRQDDREPAWPELGDEVAHLLRHLGGERIQRRDARAPAPAAALLACGPSRR